MNVFVQTDDCTLNSNPIAASTRVSALNIVADLLKKLDVSICNLRHRQGLLLINIHLTSGPNLSDKSFAFEFNVKIQ